MRRVVKVWVFWQIGMELLNEISCATATATASFVCAEKKKKKKASGMMMMEKEWRECERVSEAEWIGKKNFCGGGGWRTDTKASEGRKEGAKSATVARESDDGNVKAQEKL
jgi:hypothetical protein